MSNEKQIEQEIQDKGLNAPRITPDRIDSLIVSTYYHSPLDAIDKSTAISTQDYNSLKCLTFCTLLLKNGFTVTGESACASPENFDADIGKAIANSNAREKIWLLEGYLLKQRLFEQSKG